MVLSFPFFNDLKNAEICQWPEIVRKHQLTPQDIERVSNIVKAGELEYEWFNLLYLECKGCGLARSGAVLDKYGIKEDGIKGRIVKRWTDENNRGTGNN